MGDDITPAQVLMRKGRRAAAAYVQADCRNNSSSRMLDDILNSILNTVADINDSENIEWIKWLMAGGRTPEEFKVLVQKYDNATTCGLVWTANFVAYRCRTCGISPCMSLCAECFNKGDHNGHDFNMFRSQAGGACDCGDTSVMKETGFCDKHGPQAKVNKQCVPSDLLCTSEAIMPRLIVRLVQHFREASSKLETQDSHVVAGRQADTFIILMTDMIALGAAMRRVMTDSLTNPQLYKQMTDCCLTPYMLESQRMYQEALKSLPNPEPKAQYKDCPALQQLLVHKSFLEELMFWTVKFEFPQKLVCFLLNMLPDPAYKESLTRAFVVHYSRISIMLEQSTDPDTLSNRVVHMSVQLFSNQALALCMVEDLNLLHVMVISLKYMMDKILIPNTLHCPKNNTHRVVDCGLHVMKEHCYWPLVSDLNNVLSHRPVAVKFMSDDNLLEMWFKFLSMFQGMNVNQRELVQHVEFEPQTYYAAFSAELEASAYPMWALLSHLTDASTVDITKRVLNSCRSALRDWLQAINMTQADIRDSDQVSFHLPLHRYLSVLMCQAVNKQGIGLQEVLPDQDMLQLIMMHPLRVQVAFYEIQNGLWVRNGLQIKGQAMTYIQCNFCNSMVDADMYLLQVCATQIPADTYMQTVINKFHIKDWISLTYRPQTTSSTCDTEPETPMVESCLTFLASLISLRTNLGEKQCPLSQLEMVTLLCMGDKTHSQLMELMPDRCNTTQIRDFESVLTEVADYKGPNQQASGNMQQGMYVPKACVWEDLYDPIHVLLRAVHRRDFQSSMDRFTAYAQLKGKIRSGSAAWPPFRTPGPIHTTYEEPQKVLRTRVFHGLVWVVLYKAVMEHTVSEQVMALLIYLLEQAIAVSDAHPQLGQMCSTVSAEPRQVRDADLMGWYQTDWLSGNLRTHIVAVMLPDSEIDSDSEWVEVHRRMCHSSGSVGDVQLALPGTSDSPSLSTSGPLVPHCPQAALEGSEPMEALPPAQQPLAVLAGTEMVPASSFNPASRVPLAGIKQMALPGPSTSTQLAKRRHQSTSSDYSMELPSPAMSVDVNESIISLLLKLHSHLSGVPDSFNPDEPEVGRESRIGDGSFFVGKVLHRIMELDSFCRENVKETRDRIWPKKPDEGEVERKQVEEREKAERRRKAKERQQKLMEQFASQQKQFLEKAMEIDDEGMEWEGTDQVLTTKKEYDCVICNQTSPSTEDNPMGLAVLVQATSVLGHKRLSSEPVMLPTSDEERLSLQAHTTRAADFDRKVEELDHEFNKLSWLVSVNLGWEGGVHVQTCGHHLHIHCLNGYLAKLRDQQRIPPERAAEYSCPLCRRMANSILPLHPQLGECAAIVKSRPAGLDAIINELIKILKDNCLSEPTDNKEVGSSLSDAMRKSMEDLTNSTYPKFKQKSGNRNPQTLFLFVSSIARTNLEIELVQREGSLCTPKSTECIPKRSCIMPLLHVLAKHARFLAIWPTWDIFQLLAGVTEPTTSSAPLVVLTKEVPLLLCDPCALLTQFILLLPLHLDRTYFSCVVRLLYNLLYMQVAIQLSCAMSDCEREAWRRPTVAQYPVTNLEDAMGLTIHLMDKTLLYFSDRTPSSPTPASVNRQQLESQIQALCLPFLRIASLLRHHLYDEELPVIHSEASEFVSLVYYLELVEGGMTLDQFNAAVALSWPEPCGGHILLWSRQLGEFINRSQVAARNLLTEQHILWHQPHILSLPELYDKIFQYYDKRQCNQCRLTPIERSICLVCGTLICLKDNCCKQGNVCEAVQHSIDCGAGTAMYLTVASSYVVVIRGKRACLWGSVYLDSFGEEDRDLKRGKPLYLSPGRYQLLQQQWIGHHFDHAPKNWILHHDKL